MKLRSLQLTNFRCFKSLQIDFHDQLTVLVAENGAGKTAILDAIAVAFSPFIGGFDAGVGKGFNQTDARLAIRNGVHIKLEDANMRMEAQYPIGLVASGIIEERIKQWSRELTGKKTRTTFGKSKVLSDYAKSLQKLVRDGEDVSLPIIAYYGTGRLLKQIKAKKRHISESQSPLYGYHDALTPDSNYLAFAKWFTDKSLAEYSDIVSKILEHKASDKKLDVEPRPSLELQHVRKTIDKCLSISGWSTLQYDAKWHELVVRHKDDQKLDTFLPVAQLSDGVKAMLSLTADIAYRCVQLNPCLTSPPEETMGIVLIDEVDLHLHPKWQQTVLHDLRQAFPNIQFIVTTHSPQVLSTVKRENIRIIGPDASGNTIAAPPLAMTYGEPSGDVLHSVMMVDPQPPVIEKADLQRLTEWVDQGNYQSPEARQLMQDLTAALGERHPQLQRLHRSIQRQEAMKG